MLSTLRTIVPVVATCLLSSTLHTQSDSWPQFRGPDGLAVADETPIPASFGPGENVLWKTKVPAGHSSPCIVGNHIFLTGFEDGAHVALAIARDSGKTLWTKSFKGPEDRTYFHPDAASAQPTPVSDGERVIVSFGNYGIVALDLDGKVEWEKRLDYPGAAFGVGASPLLFDGLLIVSRDGAPEAGILALDATDGSELWRIDRFEFTESHGTPFLWNNRDRTELVVSGSGRLSSYDPGSGELLWSVNGLTNFPCTTPTADKDTLYFAAWSTGNATGRSYWEAGFTRSLDLSDDEIADPSLLFARLDANKDDKIEPDEVPECRFKDAFPFIDANQSGAWEVEELVGADTQYSINGKNLMVAVARGAEGDASESHVRWTWSKGLPYVSSPLLHKNRVWLFKSGGIVSCLDAATGKAVFDRERLSDRSEYYMSPVGTGDHVLIGAAEGTLYVLDATADELVVQHSASFDEELFATPAVLDGRVYVRARTTLWAFGSSASE